MNSDEADLLRAIFAGTALDDQVVDFATALGTAPQPQGGLLLVGTPEEEPWHFAAHLTDEAQFAGRAELSPTLVRWQVPQGAPAHLAIGLQRLEIVAARETLLVVAPDRTPERLLDRLADARKAGALIMAIDTGDTDLQYVAHESLTVPASGGAPYLDVVQHLISQAAPGARSKPSVRGRLSRLLDRVQGTPYSPD